MHLRASGVAVMLVVRVGDATGADTVSGRLWALGTTGIEERPGRLRAVFDDPDAASSAAAELGGVVEAVPEVRGPERPFAGVTVEGPFLIRPPWLVGPRSGRRHDLIVDPGDRFGHGGHVTTRLALRLAAGAVAPDDRVLDAGTGSGVLALAAAAVGATVTAVDDDPVAVGIAHANVARNGCEERIEVARADVATVTGRYDVVLANLPAPVWRRVGAHLGRRAACVVAAGFLDDVADEVAAIVGGRVEERAGEDGWTALTLRR